MQVRTMGVAEMGRVLHCGAIGLLNLRATLGRVGESARTRLNDMSWPKAITNGHRR